MLDPYKILGIAPNASDAVIAAVYRALAVRWHPDRNGGSRAATVRMAELNAAHAMLKTPELRCQTDEALKAERARREYERIMKILRRAQMDQARAASPPPPPPPPGPMSFLRVAQSISATLPAEQWTWWVVAGGLLDLLVSR